MDKLGRAAGGSLRKVAGFDQRGAIAACRGVDGDAKARGTAADDEDIEAIFQSCKLFNPALHENLQVDKNKKAARGSCSLLSGIRGRLSVLCRDCQRVNRNLN